jgi:LacI family transcriptional regulator
MSQVRRVTLSDVATRVSVTTASYILNGRSEQMRISQDASARVRLAAEQLAYRPNRNAQSLRTSSTAAIGVISDHVASGAYASQMLSGASVAARSGDHVLVIGETEGDPAIEAKLIEEMLDRRVDGIVYVTLSTSEVTVSDLLRQQRTILLNCVDRQGRLPSVIPDEYQGGRLAARCLAEAGRASQVVVVGEDPDPFVLAGPERLRGIIDELDQSGHRLAGVVPTAWSVVPAYDAMMDFLRSPMRPTGVICLNDRIAMGAYQAFAEHGLAVPTDVAVVSFDGSDLAGWLRPAVTSVAVPYADLGARAIERLLRANGGVDHIGIERVPMPMVLGESCV